MESEMQYMFLVIGGVIMFVMSVLMVIFGVGGARTPKPPPREKHTNVNPPAPDNRPDPPPGPPLQNKRKNPYGNVDY